jgi:UDP-N-acetylmuramoyl-tripeptide--D-alanyl-D-alanine ligase
MILADIVEGLTGNRITAPRPIGEIVIDSRQVKKGDLFIALPGQRTDGHEFVADAFQQGAVAAIVHQPVEVGQSIQLIKHGQPIQKLDDSLPVCIQVDDSLLGLQKLAKYWRQKFNPRVIGLTGSVGKSTTKELVTSVLAHRFNVLKSEGNFNNEIGLPLTLLKLNSTYEYLVLEMGMYDVGEITLLCDMAQPHVGVVTNVGPTHLERLGTIERIAQAKSELVQALPRHESYAILNHDDPFVLAMKDKTEAKVVTYGLSPEADLWASDVTSAGLEGIRFVFNYGGDAVYARVPLLGRHSVHTALRAALVGLVEGLAWGDIIAGLQSLPKTAQLRLVSAPGPNGSIILDDTYNASPASTIAALNLLDDLAYPRKIAVMGDMLELGSFEEEGHRKVGCRAASIVDLLITIGQRAKLIAKEAQACGLQKLQILELETNQLAIDYLQDILSPNDVVLVKGSNSQHMDEIVNELARKK